MRPNKLRELLKSNKPTLSTHIHTTWPSVVEAIGHTGLYDYVEFVGEYGPFDLHDLDNLCVRSVRHRRCERGRGRGAVFPRNICWENQCRHLARRPVRRGDRLYGVAAQIYGGLGGPHPG